MKLYDREGIKARLLKETTVVGDCWRFIGAHNQCGYGVITVDYITWEVNRLSAYIFHNLKLENNSKLLALHKIECKFKDCWNPEHIYIGNHSDNMKDAVITKTHYESRKTHCPYGHLYDYKNTHIKPNGSRGCKACARRIANEKYRRLKELKNHV